MSTLRRTNDSLDRFLLPPATHTNQVKSLPQGGSHRQDGVADYVPTKSQVPPLHRSDLPAFLTASRGTSNIIAHPSPGDEAPPQPSRELRDVWIKGLYGRASEVADFRPSSFMEEVEGKVRIVRYFPERFENCRVARPELREELVDPSTLHDDGAKLMHPAMRRRIHEQEVNGKQGEAHLRESLRQKSKLYRTCLHNYPHGALGIKESPYVASNETYSNATTLADQAAKAKRSLRGAAEPPCQMKDLLQHPM